MIAPIVTRSKEFRLFLEFTCAASCDTPRFIASIIEQAGGGLMSLEACSAEGGTITYHIEIEPRSLNDACVINEHLGEHGWVSFLPRRSQ